MIKDRFVRVKLKKNFHEQKPLSFVGKVTAFNDHWIVMDAKGILVTRQQATGAEVDPKSQATMIPRENIESIRILPDSFDMANIRVTTEGQKLVIVVDGAADVFIGVLGEG
jgi:regulator of RNase E activity RraA